MSKEFFEAVRMLEEEKGLSAEYLYEKISGAIIVAAKREYFNDKDIVFCDIDPEKEKIKVYVRKNVVEEIEDEDADILIDDALELRKSAKVGKTIDIPLKTKDFGRIVAQTAKNVIRQGIREGEKGKQYEEFQNKNQELVTAKVHRVDPVTGNATVEIGKTLAMLPKAEQVPGEVLTEGENIKIFIVDVIQDNSRGPKIMLSRTHKGLVRRLFETEVPEIFDGTIEIKSVSKMLTLSVPASVLRDSEFPISLTLLAAKRLTLSITVMIMQSLFLHHSHRQMFAVWKFLMKKRKSAVQPFQTISLALQSAIKGRMCAWQLSLQAGK